MANHSEFCYAIIIGKAPRDSEYFMCEKGFVPVLFDNRADAILKLRSLFDPKRCRVVRVRIRAQ